MPSISPTPGRPTPSDKRSGKDRRKSHIPKLKYFFFKGRRQNMRRAADKKRFVLHDRYSPRIFAAIMAILFLSVMDALFTLFLIQNGSTELNPIMAYTLRSGPFTFFAVKYGLTSMAVVIFLLFKNTYIPSLGLYTTSIFSWVIALFGAVVAWEIFLIVFCVR